jgi:hypothetical protein
MRPLARERIVDVFIDILINVLLDTEENRGHQPQVVPQAVHLTNKPHTGDDAEPVPRRPIINIPKLLIEGTPADIQITVGWLPYTHRRFVALPDDKLIAWAGDIREILRKRMVTKTNLESLLGRLNRTMAITPLA